MVMVRSFSFGSMGCSLGADKLLIPLKLLRKKWEFTSSAGAAFLSVVTARPEISINITSAARGVSNIDLEKRNIIIKGYREIWKLGNKCTVVEN